MKRLFITTSAVSGADLSEAGPSRFIHDEQFELRIVLVKVGDDLLSWKPGSQEVPTALLTALKSADEIWAPHGTVARLCLAKTGIIGPSWQPNWRCMSALLSLSALPSDIKSAAKALDIDAGLSFAARASAEKDQRISGALITDMARDLSIMQTILDRLANVMPLEDEWQLYGIDQTINAKGLPVDMAATRAAIRIGAELGEQVDAEMRELTGLDSISPTNLMSWLRSVGYRGRDMKRSTVEAALKDARTPRLRRGLMLRLASSRSALAKFAAIERAVDPDDRLRHTLKFSGASRSARWSGQIYQPQNLINPPALLADRVEEIADNITDLDAASMGMIYGDASDALAACVRPVIKPTHPEKVVIDADLASIEHAVLGWVTGDTAIQTIYREGRDPYLVFAADYYGSSYGEELARLMAGDKTNRIFGKPPVLGCGFGLGAGQPASEKADATGLLGYASKMGVHMTVDQARKAVRIYRSRHGGVVRFWRDLESAVICAMHGAGPVKVRGITIDLPCPDFLRVILPSGRAILYWSPRLDMKDWGGRSQETLSYMHCKDGVWQRTDTYGGKLCENIVQAIARDILAHGITLAHGKGIEIFLHVHDQIVAESFISNAETDLETLKSCMTSLPSWADDSLNLSASGQVIRRFRKD